jgi:outer membrane protein
MTRKFLGILLAAAVVSLGAMAQTGGAASPLPAAPSATPPPATTAQTPIAATGNKIGTVNIEQAIFASNEGQRDFEALSKKVEPKQTELKRLSDELEDLKKQLNTQSEKLNDQTRGTLVKQIEQKQKVFDRQVQDAREDFQAQQNEIAQRILQKMAPMLVKYAADNGFGVLLDTSNPWPQGPVIWAGNTVDITRAIVDTYNAQSGVPAPARPAPAATRPSAGATKPATPATQPSATPK